MVVGAVVALFALLLVIAISNVCTPFAIRAMSRSLDKNTAAVERNSALTLATAKRAEIAEESAERAASAAARTEGYAEVVGGWVRETRDAAQELAAGRRKSASTISARGGVTDGAEVPRSVR